MGKPKSKKRRKKEAQLAKVETVEELLEHLGVQECDYLIGGDGSGTTDERACGWGSLMLEMYTDTCTPHYGGLDRGTNILAEIMAYVRPLVSLYERPSKELCRSSSGRCNVHVVTDCEYVAQVGNGDHIPKKHGLYWEMIWSLKRKLILVTFHHVYKDLLPMNRFSHLIGNRIRRRMEVGHVDEVLATMGVDHVRQLIRPSDEEE